MYEVIGYKRTGFDENNLPGSRALLATMEAIPLPTTDVMQQDFLTSLTVYANWEQICEIDYLTISDACYAVTAITMTSPDVAVLTLSYDALTSIGGAEAVGSTIPILDGYTDRVCVTSDNFGEHTDDEPFTPNRPLELVAGNLMGDKGGTNDVGTYILSTVDLTDTATTAVVYSTTTTGDESGETAEVTLPSLKNAGGDQLYFMKTPDGDTKTAVSPGCRLYDGSNATVKQQVQRARECGLDGGILGQYCIPNDYHTVQTLNGQITNITGLTTDNDSGLPMKYATVKNQKALTGVNNRYYLVSMGTGNTAEYKPEDIQDGNTNPHFIIYADPRYQQMPYCRPKSYLKNTDQPYLQALPGQTWAEAPLRYESKSGSAIDTLTYQCQQATQQDANYWANAEKVAGKAGGGYISVIGAAAKNLNRWLTSGSLMGLGKGQENYMDGSMDASADYYSRGDIIQQRQTQRHQAESAALAFGAGQTVSPTIAFPRSDTMRDYFGNGFKVYRYRLSDTDLARYDQYLTMYGYAEVKPLENKDLTGRTYFNYISCSTISLGGTAPRWKREAAAQQLIGGVRIWHVKPDPAYYTSGNPIKA